MAVNRPVPRSEEPIEFRPVPGQEHLWAGSTYVPRSRLWDVLGFYPVLMIVVSMVIMIGMAI
jgi:hypothetical protein